MREIIIAGSTCLIGFERFELSTKLEDRLTTLESIETAV